MWRLSVVLVAEPYLLLVISREAVGATTVGRAVTQLIDVVGLLELALLSTVLALVVVVIRLMEGAVVAAAVWLSRLWADHLRWYRQPVT
jgi:hypothetical protein